MVHSNKKISTLLPKFNLSSSMFEISRFALVGLPLNKTFLSGPFFDIVSEQTFKMNVLNKVRLNII